VGVSFARCGQDARAPNLGQNRISDELVICLSISYNDGLPVSSEAGQGARLETGSVFFCSTDRRSHQPQRK